MNVHRLYVDLDRWSDLYAEKKDEKIFDLQSVKARAAAWKPRALRREAVSRAKDGDIRLLTLAKQFAVTPKAADALRPLFEAAGELLPVAVDTGETLYWFNCTTVIDALDWDACEILDDVPEIETYAFDPAKLAGVTLFRLPYILKNPRFEGCLVEFELYVVTGTRPAAEEFPALAAKHKLKGFELRDVWSDE